MNQKYYKVVNNNLMSAITNCADSVQYAMDNFVYSKRPGTYLFVFNDLDSAIAFAGNEFLVYECEVEGGMLVTIFYTQ